jgi:hypothetical protein
MLAAAGLLLISQNTPATPFGIFDARTMAMGGVGVATGSRYAAFNNPALLTTADESHEWFLLLPTVGAQIGDPDKLKNGLSNFQEAADRLAANPTAQNANLVQASIDALEGRHYRQSRNAALMVAIPSRILSGAIFFNVYETSTARPVIGGDVLADPANPQYSSTLAQRGYRIVENGVSGARLINASSAWMSNMAVGFNAKFLLVEAYGYEGPLRAADVDITRKGRSSSSQFAFDVGVHKEIGVWKLALMVKNIVPGNYSYGDSGEKFRIEPQARAGFAYQSRRAIWELDIDLTENGPIGFDSPTQFAAIGWEWQPSRYLALRAGYSQNMLGTKAATSSGGFGFLIGGLHVDLAAFSGDESDGVSAQLGLQF